MSSPLASPDPWNLVADAYVTETMPTFEAFARTALDDLAVGKDTRVVDVAAGPGTLSLLAAERGAKVSAIDFSERMIAHLAPKASALGIDARVGDGMALPYADASFDAGFSMFGLTFFPERARGFSELHRVLAPGARAAITSWAPMDRIALFRETFLAIGEALPDLPKGPRSFPLTTREDCETEMRAGGFDDVTARAVVNVIRFGSLAEAFASFERANAPIAMLRKNVGRTVWESVAAKVRKHLAAVLGDGPQEVTMTAWLTIGSR
jgi:ubiquinone/menaquinone biosynthesis C-methylase UbiE